MERQKLQVGFFLAVLSLVLVLTFLLLRPFLQPLIVAATFAVIFQPLHKRALAFFPDFPAIASGLAVLAVCVVVLLPLFFFGLQIFQEAQGLFNFFDSGQNSNFAKEIFTDFKQRAARLTPNISIDLDRITREGLNWLIQHLGNIFSGIIRSAFNFFLFLIALFYFFRDGKHLARHLKIISPLTDNQDEQIFTRLITAVNSVIKGALLIAVIQGFLAGIGLLIFGVPNPVLWGSTAAVASLVPNFGTALVLAPSIGYLYFTGSLAKAVGLLIWGVVAVGLVDNLLGPILMTRGIKIHPLLILLSVLGGLALFGPVGFLLGPLIISLLFALLDIHFEIIKS